MKQTLFRRPITRFMIVALLSSGDATALSSTDCDAMRRLVTHHTTANFDSLIGSAFMSLPDGGALYRLSRPASPFERCRIAESGKTGFRMLDCDLAEQLRVEPGKQSEQTFGARVEGIQGMADEYSSCLSVRSPGPMEETLPNQWVRSTWKWQLAVGESPGRRVLIRLVLEQVGVGQTIRFPVLKVAISRVD